MALLSWQKMSNNKIAAGVHTTVTAVDVIPASTVQLSAIAAAVATLLDVPSDDLAQVSVDWAGGALTIKTWKTSGTDPTPLAATTFGKRVSWMAMGT
jgi:hypothetical protein